MIAFAKLDALAVLKCLFSEVIIAESVRSEYRSKPGADTGRIDDAIADGWLVVKSTSTPSLCLSPSLGIGESDSIRLAMEDADASLLIIDDRLARRYALRVGLNVVGTVRLLDLAERRCLIGSAEHCIAEMAGFGYRVSPDLLEKIRSD